MNGLARGLVRSFEEQASRLAVELHRHMNLRCSCGAYDLHLVGHALGCAVLSPTRRWVVVEVMSRIEPSLTRWESKPPLRVPLRWLRAACVYARGASFIAVNPFAIATGVWRAQGVRRALDARVFAVGSRELTAVRTDAALRRRVDGLLKP